MTEEANIFHAQRRPHVAGCLPVSKSNGTGGRLKVYIRLRERTRASPWTGMTCKLRAAICIDVMGPNDSTDIRGSPVVSC